jgi:ribosomal protein S7
MIKNIKNIEINSKLTNCLVVNGKKNRSEKILLNSFKKLQKNYKKSSKKLFKLALIYNIPILKIHTIVRKKRKKKKQKAKIIPAFIAHKYSRTSFAIRSIIKVANKEKHKTFLDNFIEEIVAASQNKSSINEKMKETQKQASKHRRLFKYYRWS